jgi:hypothetical protein
VRAEGNLRVRYLVPFLSTILFLAIIPAFGQSDQHPGGSASVLVEQFKNTLLFVNQFEVAKKIVELGDKSVLQDLEPWLTHEDRHIRANVGFVFAGLGDDRGFQVIEAILNGRSNRPLGQGTPGTGGSDKPSVKRQIVADRYYAVSLFGDLKDARAVSILIPLLKDKDINWFIAGTLGGFGDKSAIRPLIEALDDKNSDVRFLSIRSLQEATAKKDGKVVQTWRTVLSKDGKVATITSKGTNAQGQSTSATSVWEKQ